MNFIIALNFLATLIIMCYIGSSKIIKNIILALLFSTVITAEIITISFFGNVFKDNTIFFMVNLNIFKLTVATKVMVLYYGFLLFIFITFVSYYLLKKIHLKKYKKYVVSVCVLMLFMPGGFLYEIFYVGIKNYFIDYRSYKKYDYREIYRNLHGKEYVTSGELEIYNSAEKKKNLVLIYLESYEQSYLTNEEVKKYTSNIVKLTEESEFYSDIKMLEGGSGTIAGIFNSQCGIQYLSFFLLLNPNGKEDKNIQLACLSNVLNRANYEQIFIGGADKVLFNKGNFLYSHWYDVVEDKNSLMGKYPEFKERFGSWGVNDRDVFSVAKDKYVELSKSDRPFNITILTTATHNYGGIFDERCKNTTDNGLLNAVECTDDLVGDFVDFLKRQDNYEDTIVAIMPDHLQYESNELAKILKNDENKLYIIILNSENMGKFSNEINYADFAELILKRLNVKSNAVFMKSQEDVVPVKNFIHKIHRN